MGTSNFYNRNANGIYPICMNYDDEETGETISCESYDYDETRDFVRESLETKAKESKLNFSVLEGKIAGFDRNFQAVSIARVYIECEYYGETINVYADCVSRSGYYEGANLDFEDINFSFGDDSFSDIFDFENVCDSIAHYSSLNEGLKVMAKRNIYAKIETMIEQLKDFINGVYTSCTTKYEVLAKFSNGETMYTKAS